MAASSSRDNGHEDSVYAVAFLDWLACACAGAQTRAAKAVQASGDDLLTRVAFCATAGHVLDFDDTFADGVAHVSATCAPPALLLAAHFGRSVGEMLAAYADGFEAMAAVAHASHPALYDAGWHPTAVCGPIGAAVVSSRLLDVTESQRENAVAVSLLRAGGTRGAFGSDGKAIQVGLASAAGVQAALLARAGATVGPRAVHGRLGFEGVLGARWPRTGTVGETRDGRPRAIERNWIKLYPSCLGTHAPIEAAARARQRGFRLERERVDVRVHPVARQAAHLDGVDDGLSAKFSIPYCVAHTLITGPPRVHDFAAPDSMAIERSTLVHVSVDASVPEFGAVLTVGNEELARVAAPRGAPERPVAAPELADKIGELAGGRLDGVLADLSAPAAVVLDASGLLATAPGDHTWAGAGRSGPAQ